MGLRKRGWVTVQLFIQVCNRIARSDASFECTAQAGIALNRGSPVNNTTHAKAGGDAPLCSNPSTSSCHVHQHAAVSYATTSLHSHKQRAQSPLNLQHSPQPGLRIPTNLLCGAGDRRYRRRWRPHVMQATAHRRPPCPSSGGGGLRYRLVATTSCCWTLCHPVCPKGLWRRLLMHHHSPLPRLLTATLSQRSRRYRSPRRNPTARRSRTTRL